MPDAMENGQQIAIFLNGERRAVPAAAGLRVLLESLGLPTKGILVEHNGTALFQDEWPAVRLAEGDRLELLRVVAGG